MKHWISRWIAALAVFHIVAGAIHFAPQFGQMFVAGLWNSASSDDVKLAVWFVFYGIAILVISQFLIIAERNDEKVPGSIAWLLLSMAILGVILMPVSGFWLLLPPCIGLLIKRNR